MSKIPNELRTTIAHNIRACRLRQFDGKGAAMQCAAAYSEFSGKKVSPAQWSMWERGKRSPTEERLVHIAAFFSVTVDYLRQNHQPAPAQPPPPVSTPEEKPVHTSPAAGKNFSDDPVRIPGIDIPPPPGWQPAPPGSAESFFWLARHFVVLIQTQGIRIDSQSLDALARQMQAFRL